ncbi:hypothetical protein M427DRAFT_139722 [Gonapodya prolifera JEL478]|uniref:Xylanolytic transcriptional activator regulatory domain-containing protein n=1 Tax=Gonapodya prolifera (strain JEL478) TaxID=1344416 RepID=A0A139A1Q2_GONPJ|nr:hypothetical protein M427DRAFT_139722 [Gonapodya prolifera JEL478]|eukprot:KXS10293.1 hypothetical protein M427DRAFT_139722 [Gonapodya prolifera JEL478]
MADTQSMDGTIGSPSISSVSRKRSPPPLERPTSSKRPTRHVNSRLSLLEHVLRSSASRTTEKEKEKERNLDSGATVAVIKLNPNPLADAKLKSFPHFLSAEVCYKLLSRYFASKPSHSALVHSSVILENPKPNPILTFSVLSLASSLNPEQHFRTLGKWMMFPRMKETLRATSWPSVETIIAYLHGFFISFTSTKSVKESLVHLSQACAATKLLRITSEEGLHALFPEEVTANSDLVGSNPMTPPWLLREQARRVAWLAFSLDAVISASLGNRTSLEEDGLWTLNFPCDDATWSQKKPPSLDPNTPRASLRSILTPVVSGERQPEPTYPLLASTWGKIPPYMEPVCIYTFRLATQLHVRIEQLGLCVFMYQDPDIHNVGSKIRHVEHVIEKLETYISCGGKVRTSSSLLSSAVLSAARAVLHGPGMVLERLWIKLIGERLWFRDFVPEVPQDLAYWIELKRPRHGMETEELLSAWSASPHFITAIEDASCAAVILQEAVALDPGLRNYVTEGARGWFGNPIEKVLGSSAVVLIVAAALSRVHKLPTEQQLACSAQSILSGGGPPIDVEGMVSWVVQELKLKEVGKPKAGPT